MKHDKKKNKTQQTNLIAQNRNARFHYELESFFEAGIALEGWEVKSLRQGKAQIADSYVIFKKHEAFLFGSVITPLITASTHKLNDPTRTRKLLLKARELKGIKQYLDQKGFSVVPVKLYWSPKNLIKLEIALAKGKKMHDKRATVKERDEKLQLSRLNQNLRNT